MLQSNYCCIFQTAATNPSRDCMKKFYYLCQQNSTWNERKKLFHLNQIQVICYCLTDDMFNMISTSKTSPVQGLLANPSDFILLVANIKMVKNKSSHQNTSLSIELMCDI